MNPVVAVVDNADRVDVDLMTSFCLTLTPVASLETVRTTGVISTAVSCGSNVYPASSLTDQDPGPASPFEYERASGSVAFMLMAVELVIALAPETVMVLPTTLLTRTPKGNGPSGPEVIRMPFTIDPVQTALMIEGTPAVVSPVS